MQQKAPGMYDKVAWQKQPEEFLPPSDHETVLCSVKNGVAILTLNRPDRLNTVSNQLSSELSDLMRRCDADDAVRVVILTGAGRAFCAGGELNSADPASFTGGEKEKPRPEVAISAYQLRKPVIAAINGHAVGAGINLAMTCDVRICAEDAKISFPFASRGIAAEMNGHWIAPRVMGLEKTLELFFTARQFTGRYAAEIGLVSRALPKDEVLPAAVALAEEMIAKCAPVALAVMKRLVWEGLECGMGASYERELHLNQLLIEMPDTKEGVLSFLEKRSAHWSGSIAKDTPQWPVEIV